MHTIDAHQSEYVCAQDRLLEFVSQFTGSSATVVITLTEALLWTDGRYFLQAEQELSSDWTLMRMLEPGVPEVQDWLAGCATIASLGADANLVSAARAASLQKAIHPKRLCALPENPVVKVWGDRRPVAPCNPVNIHPLKYAGVSHIDKVHNIQTLLHAAGAYGLLVTMLDEIAWLLNIRGTDIPFNPVVIAYAVVTTDGAHVFLDRNKLSSDVITHLEEAVLIHSYKDIEVFLLSASSRGKIWADDTQLSWRLGSLLESSLLRRPSPIQLLKSIKNEAELRGIREAHLRDGAALTAFIAWLNAAVKSGNVVTEYDVALKVEEFRGRLLETHRGPSFETIAGYGANGAVIHYKPKASGSTELGKDSLFLLDSGAQYIDGTTDVTRTLHFGEPTPWQKTCFTLVLKGHIALARLVFPEGIPGSRFDCVSRAPLWQHGLDYNHGTGHGSDISLMPF